MQDCSRNVEESWRPVIGHEGRYEVNGVLQTIIDILGLVLKEFPIVIR